MPELNLYFTFVLQFKLNCFQQPSNTTKRMKHLRAKIIGSCLAAMIPLFTTSCVNQIQEEEGEQNPLVSGDIPIRISTQILCTQTRINNNEFEDNDAIGLYVLSEKQTLNETRYIDNMRFTCTSSGLVPDKEVYYPKGDGTCDFIGYYPYQETGIPAGENSIDISIEGNQSSASAYNVSDFMTASVTGITPSKKAVDLKLQHKLCQLNIAIELSEADNIEDFQKNASVIINNVYTQSSYNFIDDEFTALNTPKDITPNGTWFIDSENRKLTGKKILLFPQQIAYSKITLYINNRELSAPLPNDLTLKSNTSSEITLHCDLRTGIKGVSLSIGDWQEGSKSDVTLEEEEKSNSVSIASLNFDRTNVYSIVDGSNTVIAEICKEYLLNGGIDAQAIVLYPANNKMQGTVLQILNNNKNIHGGSVSWDAENNSFTYIAGDKAPITSLYVDSEGRISYEQPVESSQSISSNGNVLTDIRGSETITYPIVKIGTQYWMRENLSTTQYNSGGRITQITTLTQATAGYFLNSTNRFYNKAAVVKGILAPQGWEIPNNKEWEKLKQYTNNTAAALKAGNRWETSKDIAAANNLTGFNAQPIGFFAKIKDVNKSDYHYKDQRVAYWSIGDTPTTLSEPGILLMHDDNAIRGVLYNDYCGLSIRCIKK